MSELMFPPLTSDDIEIRIAMCKQNGVSLLLYKDARCDMRILDETVGAFGWQRKHDEYKGVSYCSVGIYDADTQQWIWKQDAGAESFSEKEKGEASDSFKRACFNWGIGRELYTSPFIWLNADIKNVIIEESSFNDKKTYKCKSNFKVEKIATNSKKQI